MFAQIWCTEYKRTVSGEKKDDTRFLKQVKINVEGLHLIPSHSLPLALSSLPHFCQGILVIRTTVIVTTCA